MRPAAIIGGLLAINAALIGAGALVATSGDTEAASKVRIGLVFDIGGKNDKSFNTAAWRGLERAKDELGVQVEFIEPSEGADRESALRSLAARGVRPRDRRRVHLRADLERLAVQFPEREVRRHRLLAERRASGRCRTSRGCGFASTRAASWSARSRGS